MRNKGTRGVKDILIRAIAFVSGIALFVGTFVVSLVLFAAVLVLGAAAAGYFLWKTRHARRRMQNRFDPRNVIEGTVLATRDVNSSWIIERRIAGR